MHIHSKTKPFQLDHLDAVTLVATKGGKRLLLRRIARLLACLFRWLSPHVAAVRCLTPLSCSKNSLYPTMHGWCMALRKATSFNASRRPFAPNWARSTSYVNANNEHKKNQSEGRTHTSAGTSQVLPFRAVRSCSASSHPPNAAHCSERAAVVVVDAAVLLLLSDFHDKLSILHASVRDEEHFTETSLTQLAHPCVVMHAHGDRWQRRRRERELQAAAAATGG